MKTLILGWPVQPPQDWLKNYPDVTASRIYQPNRGFFHRITKNLSFHAGSMLRHIPWLNPVHWYEDWKYHVREYDTIILIDELRGRDIFEYILAQHPQCNLCVFFDSPIDPDSPKCPTNYRDLPVRFFTCDSKIAQDYQIPFVPYFYIFSPYGWQQYQQMTAAPQPIKQDVYFVGEEKGDRMQQLARLAKLFDAAGITYKFQLVRRKQHHYTPEEKAQTTDYVPYAEILQNIQQSGALLELISNGQTGLTQRAYEALFFGKKLITSSDEIKKYDFYVEQNVLVMDEATDCETIHQFIRTSMLGIGDDLRKRYTLNGWLNAFSISPMNTEKEQ